MALDPVSLGSKFIFVFIAVVALIILHQTLPPDQFRIAAGIVAAVFVLAVITVWLVMYRMSKNPDSMLSKTMVFSGTELETAQAPAEMDDLMGKRGVAESTLRPSGIATIEGKRVSVAAQGEFIDAGTEVEVVSTAEGQVTVRTVKDA